uniref:BEACH-type PH domain-containing protein n=1 Tax=Panagrolaimus sp. PS1159 TaxID=55785 RepID=A0AC35ES16_9BILA
VLDTLAEIVRNQHLLLSKNSNNPLFYGALVHLVFMLSEKPDIQYTTPNSQHLERGSAQVAMCAQNVWGILWAQKKTLLEEIFKREIDLDLYSARASCSEMANKYWLHFVDSQTDAASATTTSMSGKLPQQIQSKLSRVAKTSLQRLTSRTSVLLLSTGSITSNSIPPFHFERSKIEPETFYMWMRVHISLLKELLRNQCTRYHEWHAHKAMRAKVAISKDSKTYYERMKKRRFRTMDERIVDTSTVITSSANDDSLQQMFEPTAELNLSMIKRMVKKNVDQVKAVDSSRPRETEDDESAAVDIDEIGDNKSETSSKSENTETQPASPSPSIQLSAPQTPAPQASPKVGATVSGNGPDNQTLLRLLEHGEQLHSMFRCARIQGLDTIEGLLLFGREHYYVVDGFTLLKTREIRDLDFLPEQFHDPIIPYMAMGSTNRQSTRATRQCSKFSYDDIKDVHKRRYLLQPIALEVFSGDGRNYLLAFPRKIRDRVYQKFISMAKGASSDVAKTIAEQRKLMPTETASTGALLINSLMGQQSMTQRWQ